MLFSWITLTLLLISVEGQVITTVAGTDVVPVADGTPALMGSIEPWGVAMDTAGNLYICDGARKVVMRVDPNGRFFRFAGNGIPGYGGDGGPALDASLNDPERVVVDPQGNVYISESGNHRVRKISPDGTITTFVGNGVSGFSGDGGIATLASLNYPVGLALDGQGNLYIGDFNNHRVRRVSPQGIITTVAGNGQANFSGDGGQATQASINGFGVGISPAGELYIADTFNHRIRRVNGQGIISTVAATGSPGFSGDQGVATNALLNQPYDVKFDAQGNYFIADYVNIRIRRVSTSGIIDTVVGNGQLGLGGDGVAAAQAPLNFAFAVSIAPSGALLIADTSGHRVKSVNQGILKFVAGTGRQLMSPEGVLATSALLNGPHGVRFDRNGELLFADTYNHKIRRLRANGTITTVAGTGDVGSGGDGGPAIQATLQSPEDVAVDSSGNTYVADTGNNRIRKVTPQGVITTIAGNGGFDCGPTANQPVQPKGLAVGPNGDLYFSDNCHYIRRINAQGMMSVFAGSGQGGFADGPAGAARFNYPCRIAFDQSGNLFVADEGNHRVRRIDPAGNVTTVAGNGTPGKAGDGGPALAAQLNTPRDVAVTPAGALLISEFGNHRVRIVSGVLIDTFAGNGIEAWAGDGGPAVQASLRRPEGLAVDSMGNVFLGDWGNNRIREILASPPSVQVSFGPDPQISISLKAGERSSFRDVDVSAAILGVAYQATTDSPWLEIQPERGTTPEKLQVRANAAGLGPGTYRGSVVIRFPNGSPAQWEVPVVLNVSSGDPPKLIAATKSITFSFVEGDGSNAKTLTVANGGTGTIDFTAAVGSGSFLTVSSSVGSTTQAQPANLQVTADPTGLSPGTYTGSIRLVSAASGESVEVPVTMTVTPSQTKLTLFPAALIFRAVAGGGSPLSQEIGIANAGQGVMTWTATATALSGGSSWIGLSATTGSVRSADEASTLAVTVNHAGLPAGDYYARVDVTSPGNTKQTVSILLSVLPAGTPLSPEIRPTALVFSGSRNSNPSSQTIRIAALGTQTVSFNSSRSMLDGNNWFGHLPVGADVDPNRPATITVQPDLRGLSPGLYHGSLTFQFSDGTSQSVSILSIVTGAGSSAQPQPLALPRAAGCSVTSLNMVLTTPKTVSVRFGEPSNLGVTLLDNCGDPALPAKGAGVEVSYSPQVEPAQPLDYVSGGRWTKTFQARTLRDGTVRAVITAFLVRQTGAVLASQVEVQIEIHEAANIPVISPGAVLNGASFDGNTPLAPGTIVTLYGSGLADSDRSALGLAPAPTEFNNVQVRLGDRPLPLFYVGRQQINAQVPFDLPLNTQQQILVRNGSALSVPDRFTVGPAQPAVFSTDQTGRGQGAIVNAITNALADSSHPVHARDVISVYCTGLGIVSPAVPEGTLAPPSQLSWTVNPLRVTIGGRNAEVQFSGLAPGFVGLYQVNAFVPDGVSGDQVEVVLETGGQRSSPVTISVR